MKIKMLKATYYNGKREKEKEYEDIPSDIANRWVKNGIAAIVKEEVQEEVEDTPTDYSALKAKQLYELCIKRGLQVATKLSREAYIDALETADLQAMEEK